MSRRSLTLLLASVLALVLTAGAATARVPYVALGPGPTYDTLAEVDGTPVLDVDGRPTFPTDGRLDLTTIGVKKSLTLVQALQGWFAPDLAVVPRDVVYPPGKTTGEVDEANAAAMTASQSAATLAAARQLGERVAEVSVAAVNPGFPAEGALQEGDVLVSVDGTRVRDARDLRDLIGAREIGERVRIGFRRAGAAGTVDVATVSSEQSRAQQPTSSPAGPPEQPHAVIGVTTTQEPVEVDFDVDISLENVGGPSAGLLFTLGILEKLDTASLTGGLHIAGSGEIEPDGTVGAIGGITQKLIAAEAEGADAFLVPAANCAEAVRNPPEGLPLLRVRSLTDALAGLEALRRKEQPVLCPTG